MRRLTLVLTTLTLTSLSACATQPAPERGTALPPPLAAPQLAEHQELGAGLQWILEREASASAQRATPSLAPSVLTTVARAEQA